MKARYSYPLLFLLPSTMLACIVAVVAAAAGAGVLWIFVYGDNTWPESAETFVMAFAVSVSVITLITLVRASYCFGKNRESSGGLSRAHAVTAGVVSVLLPLLILLHQWQVGNIGGNAMPADNSSKPVPENRA